MLNENDNGPQTIMNRQVKRYGIVAAVMGALFAPQVIYAHGKNADGEAKHGETAHGAAEHGATDHGEMKPSDANNAQNAHDEMKHGGKHGNGLVDVSRWESVPAVSMEVEKDAMSGWNIRLMPHNFKFTPENANKENQIGEGHAHLYVDDKKVARLYSTWFHLPDLPVGKHAIKITLNANDHSTLAVVDNPIENTTIVEQE